MLQATLFMIINHFKKIFKEANKHKISFRKLETNISKVQGKFFNPRSKETKT